MCDVADSCSEHMYVSSVYAMSWCGSVMVHNDVDVYDDMYM